MAKAIFQAGFNWRVIETKWPGFQAAFEGFDPERISRWGDKELDRLLLDERIVRNGAKIDAVMANARFLIALQAQSGDTAAHLAHWPIEDHKGLLELLSTQGKRLGGNTGQRVCRMVGRDGYILSTDVVKRFTLEGVVKSSVTSKGAMVRIQTAFNRWSTECGRPLTQISQILAMSVDWPLPACARHFRFSFLGRRPCYNLARNR